MKCRNRIEKKQGAFSFDVENYNSIAPLLELREILHRASKNTSQKVIGIVF